MTAVYLPLAASEVDEVELPDPDMRVPLLVELATLDRDDEDGVGAGAVLVHVGRPHGPVLVPHGHHVLDLRHGLADEGRQVLQRCRLFLML